MRAFLAIKRRKALSGSGWKNGNDGEYKLCAYGCEKERRNGDIYIYIMNERE